MKSRKAKKYALSHTLNPLVRTGVQIYFSESGHIACQTEGTDEYVNLCKQLFRPYTDLWLLGRFKISNVEIVQLRILLLDPRMLTLKQRMSSW